MERSKVFEIVNKLEGLGYELYSGIYAPVVRMTRGSFEEGDFIDIYSSKNNEMLVVPSAFAKIGGNYGQRAL